MVLGPKTAEEATMKSFFNYPEAKTSEKATMEEVFNSASTKNRRK